MSSSVSWGGRGNITGYSIMIRARWMAKVNKQIKQTVVDRIMRSPSHNKMKIDIKCDSIPVSISCSSQPGQIAVPKMCMKCSNTFWKRSKNIQKMFQNCPKKMFQNFSKKFKKYPKMFMKCPKNVPKKRRKKDTHQKASEERLEPETASKTGPKID